MKSLVVYHSQYGNTRTLAEIIHGELRKFGPSVLKTVEAIQQEDLARVELLVVGGPTQAHGTSPAVKPFLETLTKEDLTGLAGATFDTRLKGPAFLWGSASKPAAQVLEQAGVSLAAPPESFLVKGMNHPVLEDGELERARAWATALGKRIAALHPVS